MFLCLAGTYLHEHEWVVEAQMALRVLAPVALVFGPAVGVPLDLVVQLLSLLASESVLSIPPGPVLFSFFCLVFSSFSCICVSLLAKCLFSHPPSTSFS